MARQVRTDVVQLNELNDTLEQRVADRTAMAEQRAEWLAQSEAALRESEELYSSLASHLPMSVLRKDRDGRFLFANEQFCRLVDQPLQSIVGKTDADFYPTELAEQYRADDRRVMESGQVFQGVEEHQTRDGRALFVEVLKVPLHDAQGSLIGTQTMFWDVTQRHDAEQRALQAERLAAIGQVVTGVAHESRNALQQIQACSQMLKWELDGDEAKQELLTDLQKAEERLVRLFDELRSYAAPLKLDRRVCDLRKIVADAWESIESQRNGRDATLAEAPGDSATDCVADPFQLEQVFRNLFENALAACNDPVRIDVAYDRHEDVDGSQLTVTVSDNGPGLTAEQHAHVFEAFFTTKTQGTGLGLSIARRIVDAHGGQICAKPTGTKGAAFEVRLPFNWSPPKQSIKPEQDEATTT